MSRACYGPRRKRAVDRRVGRGLRHWWWWDAGVRLSRHLGVLYGWRIGWSGLPVVCGSRPDVAASGEDPRDAVEVFVMGLLSKADRPSPQAVSAAVLDEAEWAQRWPLLLAYMTQDRWEDGTARATSSLLLFKQDGIIKVMLRDKDTGLCLWAAGNGLFASLNAVEGLLCDPKADWRQDRQEAGQKAKRVQRGG